MSINKVTSLPVRCLCGFLCGFVFHYVSLNFELNNAQNVHMTICQKQLFRSLVLVADNSSGSTVSSPLWGRTVLFAGQSRRTEVGHSFGIVFVHELFKWGGKPKNKKTFRNSNPQLDWKKVKQKYEKSKVQLNKWQIQPFRSFPLGLAIPKFAARIWGCPAAKKTWYLPYIWMIPPLIIDIWNNHYGRLLFIFLHQKKIRNYSIFTIEQYCSLKINHGSYIYLWHFLIPASASWTSWHLLTRGTVFFSVQRTVPFFIPFGRRVARHYCSELGFLMNFASWRIEVL